MGKRYTSDSFVKIGGTNANVLLDGGGVKAITDFANIASPSLTGTPTAPTATVGTNTTQIASTAFVTNADSGNVKLTGNQTIQGVKTINHTGPNTNNLSLSTSGTIQTLGAVTTSVNSSGSGAFKYITGTGSGDFNQVAGNGVAYRADVLSTSGFGIGLNLTSNSSNIGDMMRFPSGKIDYLGNINANNLSGTNTGDQTLSSLGAAPSSGSANYIQNGTSQQTANLNISGTGLFGSSVSASGLGATINALNPNLPDASNISLSVGKSISSQNIGFLVWQNDSLAANRYLSLETFAGASPIRINSLNFNVSQLGAAIFSSSVTATSHVTTGGTASQFVKGDGSLTVGYKVYTALLTQSGTAAPIATVLDNTLGGTVVWSYGGVGFYFGTLTNAFTSNKTFILTHSNTGNNSKINILRASVNQIRVDTFNGFSPANDVLGDTSVEIRVYN